VADPPTGVAGHPLGHGGGSATTRLAGLVVAEPPQWPKGVAGPPPVKERKKERKKKKTEGGRSTLVAQGVGRPPPVKEKKKKKNVKEEGCKKKKNNGECQTENPRMK
jgi:hypothetical protein